MTSEIAAWIEALGVIGSLVVSGIALYKSSRQDEKRVSLETSLNEKTNALQERLNAEESTEERRRFFTTLWDKMKEVQEIDTHEPAAAAVRHALNTMELVALCWQANIVDRRMVYLSFGKMYTLIYEQIRSIQSNIPHLGKTGPELIQNSPAISVVYRELTKQLEDEGLM